VTGAADLTLDELRLELAPALAEAAAFDGWSKATVQDVARARGIDPKLALAAFPRGAMQMIAAWTERTDSDMSIALPTQTLVALPMRERIRRLVLFRLDASIGREEALRRALAIMAMPQNVAETLRLGWRSADVMWRLAGDASSDFSYYSRRAILAALYAATLAVFVDDNSAGKAETRAFLDRRIGDVLRFEKAKASLLRPREDGFSMARFLGRLRYPAR
jgi:ubiquinone biosynthesis protein COQ9